MFVPLLQQIVHLQIIQLLYPVSLLLLHDYVLAEVNSCPDTAEVEDSSERIGVKCSSEPLALDDCLEIVELNGCSEIAVVDGCSQASESKHSELECWYTVAVFSLLMCLRRCSSDILKHFSTETVKEEYRGRSLYSP